MRMYYYRVHGMDRHLLRVVDIEAESAASAKIAFYLDHGDKIGYLYRITKDQYERSKNKAQ